MGRSFRTLAVPRAPSQPTQVCSEVALGTHVWIPPGAFSKFGTTVRFPSQTQCRAQAGGSDSCDRDTKHWVRSCPPPSFIRAPARLQQAKGPRPVRPSEWSPVPQTPQAVPADWQGPGPALRLLCCTVTRLSTRRAPKPLSLLFFPGIDRRHLL